MRVARTSQRACITGSFLPTGVCRVEPSSSTGCGGPVRLHTAQPFAIVRPTNTARGVPSGGGVRRGGPDPPQYFGSRGRGLGWNAMIHRTRHARVADATASPVAGIRGALRPGAAPRREVRSGGASADRAAPSRGPWVGPGAAPHPAARAPAVCRDVQAASSAARLRPDRRDDARSFSGHPLRVGTGVVPDRITEDRQFYHPVVAGASAARRAAASTSPDSENSVAPSR